MRHLTLAAFAAALLAAPLAAAATLPQPIAAAAASPARGTDARADFRRKGPELLAFAEVKPGQKVYDLIPGSGYFTRLFSLTVGPSGRVYAVWPQEYDKVSQPNSPTLRKMAAKAPFTNVRVMVQPARAFSAPEPLDLVFTSQNYHDYPDRFMGPADLALLNRQVFAALKPGGLFVIVDHRGRPGTGTRETDTLHRIDIAAVKAQVTAAGFKLVGESKLLSNPKDPMTKEVFDKSIRGNTDQFILKFRKPK
ncbi:methyltransferase [uncultured Phenylobacterium sp.]|uniref:class I SAM-dependent methyltransferase n=1 Tax=uncultured Phenylobacterium sp. TaxID=349273 RepID=UPI0025CF0712|nr:methyltransferase [uncultured Phenylobacterium sp.]